MVGAGRCRRRPARSRSTSRSRSRRRPARDQQPAQPRRGQLGGLGGRGRGRRDGARIGAGQPAAGQLGERDDGGRVEVFEQVADLVADLVAVARSILVIVWNLLNDPTARFHDLGPDYHTNRIATERRMRNHIAQLTAMGYRVTLEPAA